MVARQEPSETKATNIAFNGKFLTASPTGVHRVADELIKAYCRLNAEKSGLQRHVLSVAAPKNIRRSPAYEGAPVVRRGVLTWQFWEQIDLPFLTKNELLINVCNLGPIARTFAITMMHDAQIYSNPASYSFGFRNWYKIVWRLIGRRHDKIITVSEFSKQELIRRGIVAPENISVVPNGVDHVLDTPADTSIVQRLGLNLCQFVLGLANTQEHKNISHLLKVFSDERMSHFTLVLVGRATAEDFVRDGHTVPKNVVFVGTISDGEFRALMERALCLAFPSLTEGFGLPPLEAMLLGCPAVVSPCGALPEVCGEAAIYAEPHDIEPWIAAIRRLDSDKLQYAHLRDEARRHASGYTWSRSAQILDRVITDALERRGRDSRIP
ncbi:glycosyltransferase family 4 protein [Methylobacterium sp. J-030]|uniref:glycosyltransferase family 4 protein n=1 Tax=Methylobacterium sp. J-030 TaxID=2836627 RepID=UPI001FBBBFC0|nr:glycosyltransferase family 1 protein [Methylobacterium sp. J-030]MCJ2072972.1 glycosyltransferase family 4 protein [Methylobacterium sp. J-030]